MSARDGLRFERLYCVTARSPEYIELYVIKLYLIPCDFDVIQRNALLGGALS